jgi:hypothetical protein
MSMSDPRDLPVRLHAELDPPAVSPAFFDTLAVSAAQSTPSQRQPLVNRVGRTKIAAVMAGTSLLISGAAYAGGLMGGGDGRDSADLTPTQASTESETPQSDDSTADEPMTPSKHRGDKPRGEGKGDPNADDPSGPGSQGCHGRPDDVQPDDHNGVWWPGCHDEWPGHQDAWPGHLPPEGTGDPSDNGDDLGDGTVGDGYRAQHQPGGDDLSRDNLGGRPVRR